MKLPFIIIVVFLLSTSFVFAASVSGNVYDFSLNKVKNVIIGVDSVPVQRIVSADGTYSFELLAGNYVITANTINGQVISSENISIKDNGRFVIDLFVDLDIPEDDILYDVDEGYTDDINLNGSFSIYWTVLIIVFGLVLVFFGYKFLKNYKKVKDNALNTTDFGNDLADSFLDVIKNSGGRISQKDLRKKFSTLSEAKVSLVISELESKSKIEKFKRGRGNVILLKK